MGLGCLWRGGLSLVEYVARDVWLVADTVELKSPGGFVSSKMRFAGQNGRLGHGGQENELLPKPVEA